jgi:hypothetical protein
MQYYTKENGKRRVLKVASKCCKQKKRTQYILVYPASTKSSKGAVRAAMTMIEKTLSVISFRT